MQFARLAKLESLAAEVKADLVAKKKDFKTEQAKLLAKLACRSESVPAILKEAQACSASRSPSAAAVAACHDSAKRWRTASSPRGVRGRSGAPEGTRDSQMRAAATGFQPGVGSHPSMGDLPPDSSQAGTAPLESRASASQVYQ